MHPFLRGLTRVVALSGLAGLCAAWLVGGTLRAQEPEAGPPAPVVDTRAAVTALLEPTERVALEAQRGDWQAADAAFNAVLDAIDAQRPVLEAALGDAARSAFTRAAELLVDLASALDAEDVVRVRAVAALIASEMASMEPGVAGAAGTDGALAALEWQARIDFILALGDAGEWRDMRNEAMALTDDIVRRGPAVVRAWGGEAARHVDVARVFAMRLRSAALAQSRLEARSAATFLTEALDALAGAPAAAARVTVAPPRGGVVARAFQVEARPGDVVVVPVTLESVPQIGLGSVRLLVGWSPGALRLVDVTWDVGEGSLVRDDAAGRVEMSVPPAPVGPSGDVILARLVFEVLGGLVDPRDYLPREELSAVESGVAEARVLAAQGDTPRASDVLAHAYAAHLNGRGRHGSLYESLHRHGLADPLAATLLVALDLVTQPADTDRIFLALRELDERLAATLSAHLAALGGTEGVPVQVDVTAMTDTAGAELPVGVPVPGLVRLPAGVLEVSRSRATAAAAAVPWPGAPAATMAAGAAGARRPTSTSAVDPIEPQAGEPAGGDGVASVDGGAVVGTGFPLPLVVALIVAACAGVVAVLWSERRGRSPDERVTPTDS